MQTLFYWVSASPSNTSAHMQLAIGLCFIGPQGATGRHIRLKMAALRCCVLGAFGESFILPQSARLQPPRALWLSHVDEMLE